MRTLLICWMTPAETEQITLHQADLLDQGSLLDVVNTVEPDEIYNLAAQSFVPTSWAPPSLTGEFTALGVTRLLDAVRMAAPHARFDQASSDDLPHVGEGNQFRLQRRGFWLEDIDHGHRRGGNRRRHACRPG